LANNSSEAQALHPLARLLASRYNELRRADEQLERQNQAVRDLQRRLEQTNERLEALKAIERSLTSRPPPVLQAPLPRSPASRPANPNGSAPGPGNATGNGRGAP
jgi:DNA repair ATPase RecN